MTYTDRHAGYKKATVKATMEERSRNAEADANDFLDDKIAKLGHNLSVDTLTKAGIYCKCKKCNKTPFWTMTRLKSLCSLAKPVSVISILLYMVLNQNKMPGWIALLPCVISWIIYFSLYAYYDKLLTKGPHPLFAENLDQLRAKKVRYKEYDGINI